MGRNAQPLLHQLLFQIQMKTTRIDQACNSNGSTKKFQISKTADSKNNQFKIIFFNNQEQLIS